MISFIIPALFLVSAFLLAVGACDVSWDGLYCMMWGAVTFFLGVGMTIGHYL